jgi:hypothetical protein
MDTQNEHVVAHRSLSFSLSRAAMKIIGVLIMVLRKLTSTLFVWRQGLAFKTFDLRPDDIFIVSYPRSGTTWMQMILYQLSTDGSMDFKHISQHITFFENALGVVANLDRLPSPRIFKTHLSYKNIPKGPCKYIYVSRNGKDVAVSYYHYYTTHMGFRGDFSKFFELFMKGGVRYGSWFEHVKGWEQHYADSNVLHLTYEDLKVDLEGSIRKISEFCKFEIEPERIPGIIERCGFAFMKQHESKFDSITEVALQAKVKLNEFIRKGEVGQWKEQMNEQQQGIFNQAMKKMGPSGAGFVNERVSDQTSNT